jgi:hypothetical protein
VGCHISRDNCPSTHHRASSNLQPRKDGGIRAYRRASADDRLRKLLRTSANAREAVVSERGIRPDEHVIFDAQSIPQLDAALDRDPIADDDIILNEHAIADVAVSAYGRPREHVRECPDSGSGAYMSGLAQTRRMNENASCRIEHG